MPRIDIDAEIAAARSEAEEEEDYVVVFRGREFTIPAKAPFTFLEAIYGSGREIERVFSAARAIVGDQWDEFLEARPPVDEASRFVVRVIRLWGLGDDLGESLASAVSSEATSTPSKPTSNGSTGSSSRKRSGGRKP